MSVAGTTAVTELWAKCKAFFAAKAHEHAASDITSGTLPQARGGTGASTFDGAMTDFAFDHATDYGALYMGSDELWYMDKLPVDHGGTGSTSAAGARASLGAQETLVSGTNIKTINNQSLLGSGNINVSGGSTVDPATATPAMDGTAAVGTSVKYAREDHVHPHDNSKMDVSPGGIAMANGAVIDNRDDGYLWLAPDTNGNSDAALNMGSDGTLTWTDADGNESNVSLEGHTHAAGDIASGTLSADRIPNLAASKITTGTMSQLRVAPIYYQAKGASGNVSLASGTITNVPLVTTGAVTAGSGLSIASNGIKVTTAGRYRITASAYIASASGQTGRGCYVYKAASSGAWSSASEIMAATVSGNAEGAVNVGPKIVACAANDIIYLAARSIGAAATCAKANNGTYLLVERLS